MKLSRDRKIAIAIVSAILAIAAAAFFFGPRPVPVDRKLHAEIGAALAAEASALLRPGGKITVISRDTETFPQPAMDIVLKSFSRRISSGAEISTLLIQVDPLRPANVPPGDFFELLRKGKPEDVIVSLLGPPVLSDQQRFMLGGVRPKIVALCGGAMSGNLNLRSLFEAGLLHAAIVGRQFATATTDAARHIPRDFANLYQTYNSAQLEAMQQASASARFEGDR